MRKGPEADSGGAQKYQSRREFLKTMGIVSAGAVLAACGVKPRTPGATPTGAGGNGGETPSPTSAATEAKATQTATQADETATDQPDPEPTKNLEPTPEEIAVNLRYDAKFLSKFSEFKVGETRIGENTYKVLSGVVAGGTEELIGLEVEGVMVRLGEYKDPIGNRFLTYINPNYDVQGKVLVNEQTPQTLTDELLRRLAEKELRGISGGNADVLRKTILTNNGVLDFLVPARIGGSEAAWKVSWDPNRQPRTKANFDLPMEIVFVLSQKKLQSLPQEVQDSMMVQGVLKFGDANYGGLLWVADDGHVQYFVMNKSYDYEVLGAWDKLGATEREKMSFLYTGVGWETLVLISCFHLWSSNSSNDSNNWSAYDTSMQRANTQDRLSRTLFEYHPEK